jgi:hypothetical protein
MDQALLYTQIGTDFVCIDDLANHVAQYRSPGESPLQTLTHHMAVYRNGVLLAAVAALDSFQALMQSLLSGGVQGFAPMSALSGYAGVVKMRGEFVKRLFDANKESTEPTGDRSPESFTSCASSSTAPSTTTLRSPPAQAVRLL